MRRSSRTTSPGATEPAGGQPAAGPPAFDGPFTAIDFETADYGADSACALALVHVEGVEIVGRDLFMIRPPRSRFAFTHIHGITWAHVRPREILRRALGGDWCEAGRGDVPRRAQRLVRPGGARRLLRCVGGPAARAVFSLHGAACPAGLAAQGIDPRQPAGGLRAPRDSAEPPRPGLGRRSLRPHRDRSPPRGDRSRPAAEGTED